MSLILKIKAYYPFVRSGITIFKKVRIVHEFLVKILENFNKLRKFCKEKTIKQLIKIKDYLFTLIETHRAGYEQILHYNSIIDEVRGLFQDQNLSEKESRNKLKYLTAKVRYWSKNDRISEKFKNGYTYLLKTIKSWRNKLLVFKSHPIIPKTNNSMEHLFKEKKSWMRRTSGVKFGNKTFSLFGNYIIFVDTTWSLTEVHQFLQNANYNQCQSKIRIEKLKSRKRNAQKNLLKNWEKTFQEKSHNLILSLILC